MHVLNAALTLGIAGLGFCLAYALGALALLRKRRADLIRERLLPTRRTYRPCLPYAGPRFLGA